MKTTKKKKRTFRYYTEKECYYRRKHAWAWYNKRKIREWVYKKLHDYYEKKEMKAFIRGD